MNKVGDYTALMAGIDFVPSDPFAIVHIHKKTWCVAPHGKILGWIRWDDPKPFNRRFHVYSHGLDEGGRRVWVKSFETIGSAATCIRQHAAAMVKLTGSLRPDECEILNGEIPRRR